LLRRRRLLEDDVVFQCSVGPFAVSAVRATRAVASARARWAWDAPQARFWGAHATATSLAASFLSGEERVRARLLLPPPAPPAAAPAYVASAEALALGEMRGSLDEHGGGGGGGGADVTLTVDRILYGANAPFTSSVACPGAFASMRGKAGGPELPSELLVQDAWQEYLTVSEQGRASHLFLAYDDGPSRTDGSADNDGASSASASASASSPWFGGLMVQALGRKGESVASADADERERDFVRDEAAIQTLAEHWQGMINGPRAASALLREIADGQGLEACVEAFIGTPLGEPIENARVHACDFYCRCTREQFVGRLAALPRDDLVNLAEEQQKTPVELRCHNCNEAYAVEAAELQALVGASSLS
jgi:redox-regulated HSP33 family molecular chaperone